MSEDPPSLHESGLEIVVRVAGLVSLRSVADFEVDDFVGRLVQQAVAIARTRFEAGASSRHELLATFVRVKSRSALKHIDELVLPGMGVPKG